MDKRITCKDCGIDFVFTEGEQAFYKERGFTEPLICNECRKVKGLIRSEYIKYFNPSIGGSNSDRKKRIYHYTSPPGLYAILSNASIRFTDCQFLNDKSEYKHIEKSLKIAYSKIKANLVNDFEPIFNIIAKNEFETESMKFLSPNDSQLTFEITKKRYYVFCASDAPDSLGMWNYYVKNDRYQGYNLGFSVYQILRNFAKIKNPEIEIFYGTIIYDESTQISVLEELFFEYDQILEVKLRQSSSYEEHQVVHDEILGEMLEQIEGYRLFFKNDSFSDEREYRFVIRMPVEYVSKKDDYLMMGYDIRNGIIVPHCDLSFSRANAISTLRLSPMLEYELAKQGLLRFLHFNGYGDKIMIEKSEIPIRY